MRFYLGLPTDEDQPAITPDGLELLSLPDWETLPYDLFSPHQDITSRRIRLYTGCQPQTTASWWCRPAP